MITELAQHQDCALASSSTSRVLKLQILCLLRGICFQPLQAEKAAFEADANARATANSSSRYGQQEVCQISGLIINSEETRVRDHKAGRNYRCVLVIASHLCDNLMAVYVQLNRVV